MPAIIPTRRSCKDGDDYYMTFSSFDAYPGPGDLALARSRQLAAGRPGAVQERRLGLGARSREAQGRYYIYFPGVGPYRSNYVIWADNIRGPWSEPIDLKIGQIDPGHAVGPDGTRYLFLSAGNLVPLRRRWALGDGEAEEGLRRLEVSRPTGSSKASRRRARRSCSTATTTTWCWPKAAPPGRRPDT